MRKFYLLLLGLLTSFGAYATAPITPPSTCVVGESLLDVGSQSEFTCIAPNKWFRRSITTLVYTEINVPNGVPGLDSNGYILPQVIPPGLMGGGGGSGSGTVTHATGTLTLNQLVVGNGVGDVKSGDLTGDLTTSGSLTTVLATVNSAPGSCGDATHVCAVTTNGKGLVTAQSAIAISGVGGGGGSAPQQFSFSNATSVTLAHNLGTLNVLVGCYDNSTPKNEFHGKVTLTDSNTAHVTFSTSATGYCVVNGGVGPQGPTGATGPPGAGSNYNQTVQVAGTPVTTNRAKLNFVSANANLTVTPTDNGSDTTTLTFNVATQSGGGGAGGTNFYQTFESAGSVLTQRAKVNFVSANSNLTITPTDNGTDTTTFTLNAATQSGSGSGISSGDLASRPAGSAGSAYIATNQASGQQLYIYQNGAWLQQGALGTSGALAYDGNGYLDIVTSVVPRKAAANAFTGLNTFPSGSGFTSTSSNPGCTSIGSIWFDSTTTTTAMKVCMSVSGTLQWVTK